MSEAKPTVLLEHYLKELKLPTILREYAKLGGRLPGQERADYPTFLLRLAERELLDRERRAAERRIKAARFPVLKTLDTLRLRGPALDQPGAGAGTDARRVHRPTRERAADRQQRHRQDAPGHGPGLRRLPAGTHGCASSPSPGW